MAFLRSTIKVKMMVYKRAFLAIGQQTMGNETAVAVATPKRTTKIHPKILGKSLLFFVNDDDDDDDSGHSLDDTHMLIHTSSICGIV